MKVLVACEFSGVVRDAFLRKGHDAWSCDLLKGLEPTHGRHLKGDVEPVLEKEWDLIIAHPPCTYLCNSGIGWMTRRPGRYMDMILGVAFFKKCLKANSPKIAVENPIPRSYAAKLLPPYSQIIRPWQFGHRDTKSTCLWLKGLPLLEPTKVVEKSLRLEKVTGTTRDRSLAASPFRSMIRSITCTGIAEAMAEQWGSH